MTEKTCLIADDAPFMRKLLKDIIVRHDIAGKILEAENGYDAVVKYRDHKPDLVTMDVNMPRADGLQALCGIMKLDPTARVVMVTANEQKHIVQDAIKFGARDYITKPFDRARVPLILNKVMSQK